MSQFQVPQFIETEDRLVGPLTLKQSLYIGTAAGISGILLLVNIFEFGLWLFITAILIGAGSFLAFGKYNGRPITIFLKSLFESIWAPTVYVFKTKSAEPIKEEEEIVVKPPKIPKQRKPISIKKPDLGGIKNLWQQMNTSKTAVPKREKPLPSQIDPLGGFNKERFEAVRRITGEREVAKRIDYRS